MGRNEKRLAKTIAKSVLASILLFGLLVVILALLGATEPRWYLRAIAGSIALGILFGVALHKEETWKRKTPEERLAAMKKRNRWIK